MTTTTTTPQLIELDARRRCALGRVGRPEHSRYLVTEERDGTLIFTPAVVMTAHEAALLRHPESAEPIRIAQADRSHTVESKVRRPRPSK